MKKSLVLLLVFVMVFSLALTGCGGAKTEPAPADSQAPAAEPTGTDAAETAPALDATQNPALSRGNVLTVATSSLDGKFNSIMSDNVYDSWVTELVFEPLINNDAQGNPIPAAAKSWDISEDKLTYTFHLSEGMTFHDGTPVTADDVAFTYTTVADPDYDGPRGTIVNDMVGVEAYRKGEADSVEGIKVIDPNTISFTIVEQNVQKIWDFNYGILPQHIYKYDNWESFKSTMNNPVGSGILKFEEFKVGEYVRLSRNDNFHGQKTKLDGVIIKLQPTETATAAFAAGDIDLVNPPANLENYDIMTSTGLGTVQEFTGNGYNFVGFNLRNPKLSDKRVRQALAYSLNRELFIENQWEGFASTCNTPISPVSWAFPDPTILNNYDYDVEKARALLDEAGWKDTDGDGIRDKDGVKLSLVWTAYNDVDWPLNLIALAKENWKEIGVELEPELMEFNAVAERVFDKQEFEMFNMGWSLSIDPDPTPIFGGESDVLGGYNAIGFHNERAEEIFALGTQEYDQDKRAELYKEWAVIANEELPYLFNAYRNETWGVNNRVKNMELGPYYRWTYTIKDIELDYVQ
ncbi:ABC transporter substrate-binding protein [Fusibacter sp. 3D3]|uniref:ABC transporter substrate-binding protein n=1 Tax=Fusibacter sp. 3D3 TaxID=1048380 RepID=UPI000853336F|nr:ABC transporter substrate-binding protein [Fusibacter sp. 3D3]GAU79464.1 oligopeptide ABC transporter periplasmic oligopeptide-binding protein OppA [Fusibacter sp. 3D3]